MADPRLHSDQSIVRHGVAAGLPFVQGTCPACGGRTLFLGSNGYVTCSWIECPNPCAPSEALGIEFPALKRPVLDESELSKEDR